jgi:hypothetical protein
VTVVTFFKPLISLRFFGQLWLRLEQHFDVFRSMIVAELFDEFRNLPQINVISPVNWLRKQDLSTNSRFNLTGRNLTPTRLPAPGGGTAPVVAIGNMSMANGVWRHGSIADRAQNQALQRPDVAIRDRV